MSKPWDHTLAALREQWENQTLDGLPFAVQRRTVSLLADLLQHVRTDGWQEMIDETISEAAVYLRCKPLDLWHKTVTLWNWRWERPQEHEDPDR